MGKTSQNIRLTASTPPSDFKGKIYTVIAKINHHPAPTDVSPYLTTTYDDKYLFSIFFVFVTRLVTSMCDNISMRDNNKGESLMLKNFTHIVAVFFLSFIFTFLWIWS